MRNVEKWRVTFAVGLGLVLAGCQPSGPEALLRGDRELQAGHANEAVRLLELAATKLPTDARVWNHLGLAYHAANRLPEARKSYLRALNFDRNLSEAQFNLGEVHLELGSPREAESAFRAYLNAQPENARNPAAWRDLGQALYAEHQYPAAENALGSLLRLDARDADGWNILGLVRVQLHRPREAYQAFGEAVRLDPKLASAHLNLAVTAQQYLGDRRAALQHYRDYLAFHPADSDAIQRVVHDLELKLGLARPETPPATNSPPPVAPPVLRPTNNVVQAHAAPTNSPATNRPVVVLRTNTPRVELPPVPPPVVVVPPPRATNPITVIKPPEVVIVSRTNPIITPPSVPPAPVAAPPAFTPPAKPTFEVVRVQDEPPPQPARDPVPTPAATPTPPPPAAVPLPVTRPPDTVLVPPVVTAPPETTTQPPEIAVESSNPSSDPGVEPAKKGFWQKVNPVSWGNPVKWFRKDPGGPDSPVVPATPSRSASRVTPLEVPPVAAPEVTVATPPVFPRYEPAHPRPAPTGNRAAAEAEFQRGATAHQRHDIPAATAAYRRAVQLDPSHFEAQHNLAIAALEGSDLPTALLASESALFLQPTSVNSRYNYAVALQRSRHPYDAAEQLEQIAAQHPDDPNAHLALASLYAGDLEDAVKARRHYERVLALDPRHPQAANIRRWLERNPAR